MPASSPRSFRYTTLNPLSPMIATKGDKGEKTGKRTYLGFCGFLGHLRNREVSVTMASWRMTSKESKGND
jgi:hypothetical protein